MRRLEAVVKRITQDVRLRSHEGPTEEPPAAATRSRSTRSAVTTTTSCPSVHRVRTWSTIASSPEPGARSVHRVDRPVLANRMATLGLPLQDQHDQVVVQIGRGDRLVEPLSRACAVMPPAGRSAADHVRAVDDEHAHAASLGEPSTVLADTSLATDGTLRHRAAAKGHTSQALDHGLRGPRSHRYGEELGSRERRFTAA